MLRGQAGTGGMAGGRASCSPLGQPRSGPGAPSEEPCAGLSLGCALPARPQRLLASPSSCRKKALGWLLPLTRGDSRRGQKPRGGCERCPCPSHPHGAAPQTGGKKILLFCSFLLPADKRKIACFFFSCGFCDFFFLPLLNCVFFSSVKYLLGTFMAQSAGELYILYSFSMSWEKNL